LEYNETENMFVQIFQDEQMLSGMLISLIVSPLLLRWKYKILSGKAITQLLRVTIGASSLR